MLNSTLILDILESTCMSVTVALYSWNLGVGNLGTSTLRPERNFQPEELYSRELHIPLPMNLLNISKTKPHLQFSGSYEVGISRTSLVHLPLCYEM
jgi:hypothetical protein